MKFIKKNKNERIKMKLFIYKSLFIFFLIFLAFHLTFNYAVRTIENKIENFTSKENIDYLKDELREQIKEAISKDDIVNKEDVILLNKFLEKIKKEIY
tara:strand:- start:3166 stop:3459 length:294 start_codon:yes stop_codon:yes gene_type:complete